MKGCLQWAVPCITYSYEHVGQTCDCQRHTISGLVNYVIMYAASVHVADKIARSGRKVKKIVI